MLAGFRYGGFISLGYYAFFWSSTVLNLADASNLVLFFSNEGIIVNHLNSEFSGFSVRCLED